jgi:hypothetical protein
MAGTKVSLKLVVDKRKQRLIFAEADKEFVDFLFSIFNLPVGTVTRLLKEEGMVGCLPSLYNSIENMSDAFFQPDRKKDFLLKPRVVIPGPKVSLLLPNVDELFTCRKKLNSICNNSGCSSYRIREIEYKQGNSCSSCINFVNCISREVARLRERDGSIHGDGWSGGEAHAMSTNFGITLLREFNVKDIEEKVVDLGMDEVCHSPLAFQYQMLLVSFWWTSKGINCLN